MKVDTSYAKDGNADAHKMTVHLTLLTDEERSWTDDLLARIAANQDRLEWADGHDGVAVLEVDPATLRLPLAYRNYFVRRIGDRATVTFKQRERVAAPNTHIMWALAASLAVAFGTIGELRYNATMQFHPLTTPTLYTTA